MTYLVAAIGAKALYLCYIWLLSAITASELSRSKGYGEKAGLGTGLILSILGPIIWLERKPWQRRQKPREAEMAGDAADSGHTAITKG
jgi:hypothetical protein